MTALDICPLTEGHCPVLSGHPTDPLRVRMVCAHCLMALTNWRTAMHGPVPRLWIAASNFNHDRQCGRRRPASAWRSESEHWSVGE